MKKKILLGALALLLAISLVAIGCPAPSPTPSPTPTPTPTPTLETFEWVFTSPWPSTSKNIGREIWWIFDELEKRSEGRIKTTIRWSGELAGTGEGLAIVQSGIADACGYTVSTYAGEMPLSTILTLPALHLPRADLNAIAHNKLFTEQPAVVEELDKQNIVYWVPNTYADREYVGNKPLRSIDDFNGLRIRALGGNANLIAKFGAVPQTISSAEVYTSLDTGVVDGVFFPLLSNYSIKYYEVAKYCTRNIGLGGGTNSFMVINKDSWNALPDDLKGILEDIRADYPRFAQTMGFEKALFDEALAAFEAQGIEIVEFPEESREALVAEAALIWDEWAEENGGEVARQVLDFYRAVTEELTSQYPSGLPTWELPPGPKPWP